MSLLIQAAHYYTYGLALKDTCGGTSIPTLYHTSINLKVTTSNGGLTNDLTWNAYGGLPFGVFELHKETTSNPDFIFDNVSSNLFSYNDGNTAPDTVLAYWITVPLDGACDTIRAANVKTNSNVVRRDIFGGIKQLSAGYSTFEIIPNPNNGVFTLKIVNDFRNQIEVDIVSVVGAPVWSSKIPAGKKLLNIDLPELPQGVYFIQLTENNKKQFKKMVISK